MEAKSATGELEMNQIVGLTLPISWASFKGPSFAKLEICNEIIECLLQNRQIDVNSYHLENEEVDEAEWGDPQSS